jgi:hypothetical protein
MKFDRKSFIGAAGVAAAGPSLSTLPFSKEAAAQIGKSITIA